MWTSGGVQAFLPGKEEGGGNGKQTNWKRRVVYNDLAVFPTLPCPTVPMGAKRRSRWELSFGKA